MAHVQGNQGLRLSSRLLQPPVARLTKIGASQPSLVARAEAGRDDSCSGFEPAKALVRGLPLPQPPILLSSCRMPTMDRMGKGHCHNLSVMVRGGQTQLGEGLVSFITNVPTGESSPRHRAGLFKHPRDFPAPILGRSRGSTEVGSEQPRTGAR